MALHEVVEVKKVMILGNEIILKNKSIKYYDSTSYGFKPYSGLVSHASRCFKYTYEHHSLPPTLLVSPVSGKKYIVPIWQEVHPQTTLADIEWIRPVKVEVPVEKETWMFESSSEKGIFYKVSKQGDKLTCNCSGFWRCLDRTKGCKHVQEVRKQLTK
jgi:hypothetical protein